MEKNIGTTTNIYNKKDANRHKTRCAKKLQMKSKVLTSKDKLNDWQ